MIYKPFSNNYSGDALIAEHTETEFRYPRRILTLSRDALTAYAKECHDKNRPRDGEVSITDEDYAVLFARFSTMVQECSPPEVGT